MCIMAAILSQPQCVNFILLHLVKNPYIHYKRFNGLVTCQLAQWHINSNYFQLSCLQLICKWIQYDNYRNESTTFIKYHEYSVVLLKQDIFTQNIHTSCDWPIVWVIDFLQVCNMTYFLCQNRSWLLATLNVPTHWCIKKSFSLFLDNISKYILLKEKLHVFFKFHGSLFLRA